MSFHFQYLFPFVVFSKISGDRRGTIRYVGPLETKPGVFIGIELDEPLGRNNGSFEGKALFHCSDKHGLFIRPKEVEIGDFPSVEDELEAELNN